MHLRDQADHTVALSALHLVHEIDGHATPMLSRVALAQSALALDRLPVGDLMAMYCLSHSVHQHHIHVDCAVHCLQ